MRYIEMNMMSYKCISRSIIPIVLCISPPTALSTEIGFRSLVWYISIRYISMRNFKEVALQI